MTPCFWLEPTMERRVRLRVFTFGLRGDQTPHDGHEVCPAKPVVQPDADDPSYRYQSGHDAWGPVVVDAEPAELVTEADGRRHWAMREDWPADDPRWPTTCEDCSQTLPPGAEKQTFVEALYRRTDTGETMTLRSAPPGAMWDAWWFGRKGPDGIALVCRTPGGDWTVDGRASNCTLPDDDVHRCWVRHGDPKTPGQVTIDKNGVSCAAGAGSIQAGDYHGMLQAGALS